MTTISMSGVTKAYGRTQALAGADLQMGAGEIIGIAGPNGAGKSTLTKVLAGEEACDNGHFLLDGGEWDPREDQGVVAVVHQEPQIWPNLSVLENLLVGRSTRKVGVPQADARDHQVLDQLGLASLSGTMVAACSLAVRQRTEIARAMVRDARCYIFDEPNSALTEEESDALFRFMHELADGGHVVALISHRLGELVAHCDRVVVVRDGAVAQSLAGEALSEEAIAAELVVGHPSQAQVSAGATEQAVTTRSSALVLTEWTSGSDHFDVPSLTLRSGSVTALVGVEGSGARELSTSLAGFHPTSGRMAYNGVDDLAALQRRTTFLSADRRGMLFDNLTVGHNLVARLGVPRIASRFIGLLRSGQIRRAAEDAIERFGVKTEGPQQPITALSGGNQQKVAIAAALVAEPSILVIEEPTRGVDVGSKSGIYATLLRAAQHGIVVVVFCTEVPEVFDLADRFIVVDRGRVILDGATAEYADVTELAEAIATAGHIRAEFDHPESAPHKLEDQ